jgi:hypothetical protein
MFTTGGRSPVRYIISLIAVIIAVALRVSRDRGPDLPESRPPSITVEPQGTPQVTLAPADEVLAAIRSAGYRVTVHEFVGALEMRAASASDPNQVVQTARVDRPTGSRDAKVRCARELAKKLGIEVPATP